MERPQHTHSEAFMQCYCINGIAHTTVYNVILNQNAARCLWNNHVNSFLSINQQTTSVGKDVGKMEPLYTVGGNANWCSHCG